MTERGGALQALDREVASDFVLQFLKGRPFVPELPVQGAKREVERVGERLTGAKRGTITIRTILEHIGTTSLRLTHRMYREWESDPVAVAELVVAHVDTSTRHGCEFPAVLRAKMRPFLEGGSNRSTALVAVGDPA